MKTAYKQHVAAIVFFSLLALLMTYPVVRFLGTRVAGSGGDPWQTMWRMEVKSSGGFSAFVRDVLGVGEPQLANLSAWPWAPLHTALGQPYTYNIVWLLSFILAGYGMAFFVQTLTREKSIWSFAPVLAGIAYMFTPYHVAHALGHFGAMQGQWIPFIASAALVFVRTWKIRTAIVLGGLLTLQAWTEHHYILWLFLFGLIAMFVYRKELYISAKGHKRAVCTLGIIAGLGVLLPFVPTIRLATEKSEALNLGVIQTIRFSADLFSFITPAPFHPVWGSASYELFGQYFTGNIAESVQYLGIVVLLPVLFFSRHIPIKQKRLWITSALFFGIMSLGPVLHVFGNELNVPLPYALLVHAPVFSAIRVIARSGVMVGFATAVLFGWVITTNKLPFKAALFIGVLLLVEFAFFPFPMQQTTLSSAYGALQDVRESKIIELPAATNYTAASRSLYASAFHNKEVFGNIALERGKAPDEFDLEKSVPAIRQLLFLRTTDLSEMRKEFFGQDISETLPDAMEWLDIGAIIVHTDSLSELQNVSIEEFLGNVQVFAKQSFGDTDIYIKRGDEVVKKSDGMFLVRGDGWENVGFDPKRESVFAEIPSMASVKIVNTLSASRVVTLSFNIPDESQRDTLIVKDQNGSTVKPELRGDRLMYTFPVPPGEFEISFSNTGSRSIIIQNPLLGGI